MIPQETEKNLGVSVSRSDARDKVWGKTIYVGDIRYPRMLYGKAVRSPYAHALIKEIDASQALSFPGVVAVYSAADIPGENITGPRVVKDQPVLAPVKVRFALEAVAVVAAESEVAAVRGADLVKVTYEPLPVVDDVEKALDPGAPLVHEQGNLCHGLRIVQGDFAAALDQADLVLTRTYRTQMADHSCLEPDGATAEPDGDGIKLRVCSKGVHLDRGEVARVLGLSPDKVRISVAAIGGSFGSKPDHPSLCMAALIAWKTGRPARVVLNREECFFVKTKKHPYVITYTHAVRRDGKILGVRVDALADACAYSSYTPSVITRGLVHAVGPYVVPNVEMEVRAAFTNHPITGAFRGYGEPQFTFASERQMDLIASELGLDPLEVRMRNLMGPGAKTPTGQVLTHVPMEEILRKGQHGLGRTGLSDEAEVTLRLEKDGHFQLFVGCPDTGQGSDTALAQIAAQGLGVPMDLVQVTSADTLLTRDTGTTTATRVTYVVGNAVKEAAIGLRARLLSAFEKKEGSARTNLEAERAWLAGLATYCRNSGLEIESVGHFGTGTTELDEQGQGAPYGAYSFGVQWTRVRVDTRTCAVEVERIVGCYDVGRIINPVLLAGQVEGATVMALGFALTEEIRIKDGVVANPNFHEYLLPTAADVPPITQIILESGDPSGPFGAKGIGELTAVPGAASLANAVSAALGIEVRELPVMSDRLWALVAEKGRKK
jgi:CO/xanthine dehydrogenase Mo-binding subunit